jgi:hypothetical protein
MCIVDVTWYSLYKEFYFKILGIKLEILYVIDDLEPQYPRDQNYIIRYMLERGHDVTIVTTRSPSGVYDQKIFCGTKIHRYPCIGRIGTIKIYPINPLKLSRTCRLNLVS